MASIAGGDIRNDLPNGSAILTFSRHKSSETPSSIRPGDTSYLVKWATGREAPALLISENNDLSAELNLAQAQLNERLALVQLYNALGGGWQ
jgi:multidrug efflux system outer membrane protein